MSLDYAVRTSNRAKHVSIRVDHRGKVEVVVPRGFNQRRLPEILATKQAWVERALQKVATQRELAGTDTSLALPQTIELRSLLQTWQVACLPTSENASGRKALVREQPDQLLTLHPDVLQENLWQATLQQWVWQQAKHHLALWLQETSEAVELPYNRVAVRRQRSRWGSCSNHQNINLNYKLMFLPLPLVQYVCVHELCHTVHLNHSARFWQLVEQHCSDYRQREKDLKQAWRYVPMWADK